MKKLLVVYKNDLDSIFTIREINNAVKHHTSGIFKGDFSIDYYLDNTYSRNRIEQKMIKYQTVILIGYPIDFYPEDNTNLQNIIFITNELSKTSIMDSKYKTTIVSPDIFNNNNMSLSLLSNKFFNNKDNDIIKMYNSLYCLNHRRFNHEHFRRLLKYLFMIELINDPKKENYEKLWDKLLKTDIGDFVYDLESMVENLYRNYMYTKTIRGDQFLVINEDIDLIMWKYFQWILYQEEVENKVSGLISYQKKKDVYTCKVFFTEYESKLKLSIIKRNILGGIHFFGSTSCMFGHDVTEYLKHIL